MFSFLSLILYTNLNLNIFRQFIKRLYLILAVRDIYKVYRIFREMIYGTHIAHIGSPKREEACSFCFLALRLISRVDYSFL
jgi:hypothetical protein